MPSFLKDFLAGACEVLVLYPDTDYEYPANDGFAQDAKNLRGDFEQVASDMRKGVAKHGYWV